MEYYYGSISSVKEFDDFYLLENNQNFKTSISYEFLDKIKSNKTYDEEYGWISVKLGKKESESLEKSYLANLIQDYFNRYDCEFVHIDLFRKFSL